MTISPAPQDSTAAPAFGFQTLRDVLAKMQAEHPERACRIERAAMIVALRRIEQALSGPGAWWVESERGDGSEYYVVHLPQWNSYSCTCMDFRQRGGPCKHGLSIELNQRCEAMERGPEPPPIPFPARTLTDDEPIPFVLTDKALAVLDAPPTTAA
jgi:hypothetical protein